MKRQTIMIVAGEASGDRHAAKLVKALRQAKPELTFEFFGAAGPLMREAGVEPTVRSDNLSVVGLTEIAKALPMFLQVSRRLRKAAAERNPSAVILVDFPDFNLKLARSLKKRGHTIIYYISPQLWAWRKYRVRLVRRYVDLMITILPFEKAWYARHGVEKVEYVGNPLAREVVAEADRGAFMASVGLDLTLPLVALLPGSRSKEIERILPVMLEAAQLIRSRASNTQFVIPVSTEASRRVVDRYLTDSELPFKPVVVLNRTYDAVCASDAAAVTSGTATLETALLGTPMVIVYKTSAINYALLEPLISVEHYGLVNLIAGERLATELIQKALTPERLANEICRLLDSEANAAMRRDLSLVSDKLGHGGASKRAADAILDCLERRCGPS